MEKITNCKAYSCTYLIKYLINTFLMPDIGTQVCHLDLKERVLLFEIITVFNGWILIVWSSIMKVGLGNHTTQ